MNTLKLYAVACMIVLASGSHAQIPLPYGDVAASEKPLFKMTNTGTGPGIEGKSVKNVGILASSDSTAGLYGTSTKGPAASFETFESNASSTVTIVNRGTGIGLNASNRNSQSLNSAIQADVLVSRNGSEPKQGISGIRAIVSPSSTGKFATGISGINFGSNDKGIGVLGFHASAGMGVYGESQSGVGVYGTTATGVGLHGYVSAINSSGIGVRGETITPTGVGVEAKYSGTGVGTALEIENGALRVTGANRPAFVHTATAANKLSPNGTDIDHPFCNGEPMAILIITPRVNAAAPLINVGPVAIQYNATRSKWEIINLNATIPITTGAQFNVLVVRQ